MPGGTQAQNQRQSDRLNVAEPNTGFGNEDRQARPGWNYARNESGQLAGAYNDPTTGERLGSFAFDKPGPGQSARAGLRGISSMGSDMVARGNANIRAGLPNRGTLSIYGDYSGPTSTRGMTDEQKRAFEDQRQADIASNVARIDAERKAIAGATDADKRLQIARGERRPSKETKKPLTIDEQVKLGRLAFDAEKFDIERADGAAERLAAARKDPAVDNTVTWVDEMLKPAEGLEGIAGGQNSAREALRAPTYAFLSELQGRGFTEPQMRAGVQTYWDALNATAPAEDAQETDEQRTQRYTYAMEQALNVLGLGYTGLQAAAPTGQ